MPPVFAILLVLGFVFSGRVNYVYSHNSVDSIRHNENQIAYQRIEELFGIDNQMAIIVPAGDYGREAKLISEVEELSPHRQHHGACQHQGHRRILPDLGADAAPVRGACRPRL